MSQLQHYIDKAINEEYHFEKLISKTAVNEIKLYKHLNSSNQLVVIKSEYRNDDVFRLLKTVNTQGVMPEIYEVSSEENYLLVLEEYIEGTPLDVKMQQKLTTNEIKQILIDICTALEILHSKAIIHRDIKPENVIIRNNQAVLIDFSIAKVSNSLDDKDTVNLGTIGYAAPEQFGIFQSLPATDIYAFGVMANELVLGVHPTVNVPKGKLGKIINKCISTQMSKRYQTATELKKELKKI